MTKQNLNEKPTSSRGIENCRAVEIGVEKFAECLKQGPNSCRHALPFGYCFLCTNPRVGEIVANTRKTQILAGILK